MITLLFGAAATACAASAALTPAVRTAAIRLGHVARPSSDRWSKREVALEGGVAVFIATMLAFVVVREWLATPGSAALGLDVRLRAAIPTIGMFVVGWIDDRISLKPTVKFACQVVAGAYLPAIGYVLNLTPLAGVNTVLTVFWFVALTNAVNLLDNMDGVAAGVTSIASLFLGIALARAGAIGAATFAWCITGAAVGFLIYNFNPASIFMGDAGSLFLGSALATLSVLSPTASSGSLASAFFVPLAIVAVPIADTTLVTITRILDGRGISQGGRDHTTHRLVALGLSERQTALLLYGFSALGGTVALALSSLRRDGGFVVGLLFLVVLLLLAAYLGRMHVEHSTAARGNREVTLLVSNLLYKKRLAEMLLDATLVTIAYYSAFWLRYGGVIPPDRADVFQGSVGFIICVQIALNTVFGCYRGTWRYLGLIDGVRLVGALTLGSVGLWLFANWPAPTLGLHTLPVIYGLSAATLVLGSRVSFRLIDTVRNRSCRQRAPVMIYGAGDAGELALRELYNNLDLGFYPACFIDDDPLKHHLRIHGVEVVGGLESIRQASKVFGARKILVGARHLRPEMRAQLESLAREAGLELIELDIRLRPPPRLSLEHVVGAERARIVS